MAADPRLLVAGEPRVQRFGATERHLHTIHATAFSLLLLSGFALYLPFLAQIISDRPLMKAIHLLTAVGWLTALALVVLLGDRAALRSARREIERFDADDLLFRRRRRAAAGRFNGGQKAHAILQAALSLLFVISGVLLWLGERNTELRLPGTLALHDAATLLLAALTAGHIFKALSTAGSLEAVTRGTVSARYAAQHHEKWRAPLPAARERRALAPTELALAVLVLAAGAAAVALLL